MMESVDIQTLLMIAGGLLVVVALFLLIKQLFKMLLIVALLLLLLAGGYHYLESTGKWDRSPELRKIGDAVDRVTEMGSDALDKGRSIKAVVDTIISFSPQQEAAPPAKTPAEKREPGAVVRPTTSR